MILTLIRKIFNTSTFLNINSSLELKTHSDKPRSRCLRYQIGSLSQNWDFTTVFLNISLRHSEHNPSSPYLIHLGEGLNVGPFLSLWV